MALKIQRRGYDVALLEVKQLCAGYGDLPILHGISLHADKGEVVAVVGSNGAGKTTLLRTICGLIEAFSGEIIFNGEASQGMPPHKLVGRGISLVPEGRQLFNYLTVEQNLMIGSTTSMARSHRKENFEMIFELFTALKERKTQQAGTLSGGEQQMLATARGLMAHPLLLMMDEPSWGLAPILTNELFETVQRVNKEMGTTILLVEQNVYKTLTIAHRGYVLERGRIAMEGKGNELLQDKRLKETYLGM
jgi:branched-chain amino acid transport system ATP-binding protein